MNLSLDQLIGSYDMDLPPYNDQPAFPVMMNYAPRTRANVRSTSNEWLFVCLLLDHDVVLL